MAKTKEIQSASRIKQRHNIKLSFDKIYADSDLIAKQLISPADASNHILDCDAG
jgi:hypothetical protein